MEITRITLDNLERLNMEKYCTLLRYLSNTITVSDKSILERIIKLSNIFIFIFGCLEDPLGSITCIMEPKVIHDGKFVAHVEDVVVHPKARGQKIASQLLHHVQQFARDHNCYKILLHCHPSLLSFYEGFGFSAKELIGMRYVII